MPYYAKVILDSIGPCGNRLTTMEFTIPKLWLAEFNTHCMFARNSASTRAIPFQKQVDRVIQDPYIPHEWPLESPGMVAKAVVEDEKIIEALRGEWIYNRDVCAERAMRLNQLFSLHKQLAGRLLELWQFQTVLVTGDQAAYANFFHLRRDKGAAPEIRKSANLMWEQYSGSRPVELRAGEWHCPLLHIEDTYTIQSSLCRISAARCARLSYLTHHGKRDIQEDLNLFHKLTSAGHWSPLEHVCQAQRQPTRLRSWVLKRLGAVTRPHGKWSGWTSLRSTFANEYVREYHG